MSRLPPGVPPAPRRDPAPRRSELHAHRPGARITQRLSRRTTNATEATTSTLGGAVPAALVTIGAYRDQSIEELRAALGLSQPGTVRLVDRLAAEGWVERRPGRRPRTVALALTPAGRRMTRRVVAARERAVRELIAPLSAAEADALTATLERLLHARGHEGRDPDRVCRLCERAVCERCPVAEGSDEAGEPPAAPRPG